MFNFFNILPIDYSNFGVVFLVGIIAGISTCGGLLSSFVLGISGANFQNLENKPFIQKIKPHLLFNLGRVVFFTFFGFLSGLLGQFLIINNFLLGLFVLLTSLYLLILGIKLLKISKIVNSLDLGFSSLKILFPKIIHFKEKSISSKIGIFLLGGLTFFLPCGFTQAIQIYTITLADPFYSGLTMFIFSIGTMPGLLSLGAATTFVQGKYKELLTKIIGVVIVFFSLLNIINSFNLLGINPYTIINNSQNFQINAAGFQEVKMVQNHKGYEPNLLIVKKNIPVKLIIDSKNNTTCASYIVIEKFNIRKFLELGINTLEFTPTEAGDFQFSCGMGMHPGIVRVIE